MKDAVAMWWDANQVPPTSPDPGCWRMVDEAKRYIIGQFPAQEINAMKSNDDPCNGYRGGATLRAATP